MIKRKDVLFMGILAVLLVVGCYWMWKNPQTEEVREDIVSLIPQEVQKEVTCIRISDEENSYAIKKIGDIYQIEGEEKDKINQGLVESIFFKTVHLQSIAKAQKMKKEDCGLGEPSVKIEFYAGKENLLQILIGRKSSVLNGYFSTVQGKEEVYLIASEFPEEIIAGIKNYRDMALIDFLYTSDYEDLQSLKIEGENQITVVIEQTGDGFALSEPVIQMCSQDAVMATYLHDVMHLRGDEYVGNHAAIEMGLDKPAYQVTVQYRGEEIRILVGNLIGNSRYVQRVGEDSIYLIREEKLKFLNRDYREAIGDSLYYRSVGSIEGVEIKFEDANYILTDVKNTVDGYTAKLGKRTVPSNVFLPIYNNIRGLELFKNITEPGKPEIQMTIRLIDGGEDEIILGKLNDREYSVSINGICSFSTSKASVDRLKERINELIKI